VTPAGLVSANPSAPAVKAPGRVAYVKALGAIAGGSGDDVVPALLNLAAFEGTTALGLAATKATGGDPRPLAELLDILAQGAGGDGRSTRAAVDPDIQAAAVEAAMGGHVERAAKSILSYIDQWRRSPHMPA
jgi:hypothetical protein